MMKISKLSVVMLGFVALSCESKTLNSQNFKQDATQIQEPVLYIDQYGKYSKISNTMKITLVDYGNKRALLQKAILKGFFSHIIFK